MPEVLVVGQSPWISADLVPWLRERGHIVTAFDDGAAGAAHALRVRPDVVVTELDVPGVSGAQLHHLLQSTPLTARIPLVLLTGSAGGPSRLWAQSFESARCVPRNDPAEVEAVLREVIARSVRRAPAISNAPPSSERSGAPRRALHERLSGCLDDALFHSFVSSEVRALATAPDTRGLFGALTSFAAELLGYDWLALVIDGPGEPLLLHARPSSSDRAEREARAALDVPEDVVIASWLDDRPAVSEGEERVAIEVPIFFGAAKVGQIAVSVARARASRSLKRLVDLVAFELGGPLRVRLLLEEARVLASTDLLTGLMNRRSFLDALGRERARVERHPSPVAVGLLDVDHFKRVNDELGHEAGDDVLVHVAEVLRKSARASDLVARWGGEEFVVLLPGTSAVGAARAFERMRCTLAESLRVTASFGVVVADRAWDTSELLRRADVAMYEAKRRGRNRVVFARSEPGARYPLGRTPSCMPSADAWILTGDAAS